MKRTAPKVELIEVDNAGLISLIGKKVSIMSVVYHYAGTLVGVNNSCVELEDAGIVYLTGRWDRSKYEDFQKIPTAILHVAIPTIEAFFETDKI